MPEIEIKHEAKTDVARLKEVANAKAHKNLVLGLTLGVVATLLVVSGSLSLVWHFKADEEKESLIYAWSNARKVEWLKAADMKAQANSQQVLQGSLARLFIEQ